MKQNNDNRINVNNLSVGVDAHGDPCKKHRFNTSNAVANRVSARGITLIALVITIIILLILAGVALTLTIGENGIINHAKTSKETYSEAQAREKLEMTLIDLQADKLTKPEYNDNTYINERLTSKGFTVEEDIVIVDKWQFEIDRSVPKKATSLGQLTEEEMLNPTILRLSAQVEENNIKVVVRLRNIVGTQLTYSIKKDGADVDLQKAENQTELEYTFSNLEKGIKYNITVYSENENGTDSKTIDVTLRTITIEDAESLAVGVGMRQKIECTISPEPENPNDIIWTSSNESIVTVDNEGYITGIEEGETTVTLRIGELTKEFNVKVVSRLFALLYDSAVKKNVEGVTFTCTRTGDNSFSKVNGQLFIYQWNGYTKDNFAVWTLGRSVLGEIEGKNISVDLDLVFANDYSSYTSGSRGRLIVNYEDGTNDLDTTGVYTNATSGNGHVEIPKTLTLQLENKPIKDIQIEIYYYDSDWGGAGARIRNVTIE